MSYKIDFAFGKLPNGWPQPTFMSFDEDGGLHIEWCFGGHDTKDNWRVGFSWWPDEGAMICRTTQERQDTLERPAETALAATLHEWLTMPPSSVGEEKK